TFQKWFNRQAEISFCFRTTKVHPGEDVTLQCTNNSKMDSMTFWFRLVNSTTVQYISRLVNSKREATYSDGFRNGKFEMTTNIITLFLKIKKVDQSDSGLYFCGFHSDRRLLFSVTHLNVGGKIIHAPAGGSCARSPMLFPGSAGATRLAWESPHLVLRLPRGPPLPSPSTSSRALL
uniref:Ig-like domain-containing protein n=1 Tax=Maylandia zebra TaxID=106582 RepID=A0A3P9BGC7_9CICH